jgi:hypothetical protein
VNVYNALNINTATAVTPCRTELRDTDGHHPARLAEVGLTYSF